VALGAGITLLVPELAVNQQSMDFGPVVREETDEHVLTIANQGTGVLEWEASTRETWIEVAPEKGTLGPGRDEDVVVRVYPLGLPAEVRTARGTLQVVSNGGQVFVEVTMGVAAPHLFLGTVDLDLGTSENYAPLQEVLRIFNRGTGTLQGEASSEASWMTVEPREFACETGMSTSLQIAVDPVGLPPDVQHEGVLTLQSNGGDERVTVRLRVATHPTLEVQPHEVWLEPDPDTGGFAGEMTIRNTGYGVMDVSIHPGSPWLSTPRSSYRVRRGRPVRVPLAATPDAPSPGQGILVVTADDAQVEIAVHLKGPE